MTEYNDKPWLEFKRINEKKLSDFPIAWAFSPQQLDDLFKKLEVSSTDELYKVSNGGFIRKTDADAWDQFVQDWYQSLEELQKNDDNLLGALVYELGNHEYNYTYDASPAVEAVGLEPDTLTEREIKILHKANDIYWRMERKRAGITDTPS